MRLLRVVSDVGGVGCWQEAFDELQARRAAAARARATWEALADCPPLLLSPKWANSPARHERAASPRGTPRTSWADDRKPHLPAPGSSGAQSPSSPPPLDWAKTKSAGLNTGTPRAAQAEAKNHPSPASPRANGPMTNKASTTVPLRTQIKDPATQTVPQAVTAAQGHPSDRLAGHAPGTPRASAPGTPRAHATDMPRGLPASVKAGSVAPGTPRGPTADRLAQHAPGTPSGWAPGTPRVSSRAEEERASGTPRSQDRAFGDALWGMGSPPSEWHASGTPRGSSPTRMRFPGSPGRIVGRLPVCGSPSERRRLLPQSFLRSDMGA